MNRQRTNPTRLPAPIRERRKAFTLTEVVIAVGVFAFALVSNYALFGLSLDEVRQVGDRDAAVRAASALQGELGGRPWNELYDSVQQKKEYLVYSYRGSLGAKRSDGTALPCTAGGVAGVNYSIQSVMRSTDSPLALEDNAVREGALLLARIELSSVNPGGALPAQLASHTEATIAVKATFFEIGAPGATPGAEVRPVYTCTLTCLR